VTWRENQHAALAFTPLTVAARRQPLFLQQEMPEE
jgi:hypothetical protein